MYEIIALFSGVLGIIFLLAYLLITGIITMWLAYEKGYSVGFWAFMGLFFGLIALLGIGFAPDKRKISYLSEIYNILRKNDSSSETAGSSVASSKLNISNTKTDGGKWVCKKCGDKNNMNSTFCKGCGEYK